MYTGIASAIRTQHRAQLNIFNIYKNLLPFFELINSEYCLNIIQNIHLYDAHSVQCARSQSTKHIYSPTNVYSDELGRYAKLFKICKQ